MLEHHSGVILNFSSTAGYNGMVRKSHYVTAKASLRAFTKAVALEVNGPIGIPDVTAWCPAALIPAPVVAGLGQAKCRSSRASTWRPIGLASCKACPSGTSRRRRTSPTWHCSWPVTRAGPSPGSRSQWMPAATCRDRRGSEDVESVGRNAGGDFYTGLPGALRRRSRTCVRMTETVVRLGYNICHTTRTLPCHRLRSAGGGAFS